MTRTTEEFIREVEDVSAHNYHPIPVVIAKGDGIWVTDVEGKKYIDMLSAYSALNQGHRHPKILDAAKKQLDTLTLTSRAFHNDQMGPFLKKFTRLAGYDKALPMNTGAEAVETAIKAARRWGYNVKRVPEGQAEIIVCENNFHGRTTTIVGFSTDPVCNGGFGPFTPGFKIIPYGDAKALEAAITPNTVGFMVEPIQGEAGVLIPPSGYLKACRDITKKNEVLFITDEIQTGLGRTGRLFCFQHDGVRPDIVIVGKALGGGVYPVSAILAGEEIMAAAFEPGNHGSTFGGNPLACAVASASLDVIIDERLVERSAEMGEYFLGKVKAIKSQKILEARGRGLLMAIELKKEAGPARKYTEALMKEGVLAKETHVTTIRFAPPLIIRRDDIDWAVAKIAKVLA
jgi:ornithine--oxo-acid transaminase